MKTTAHDMRCLAVQFRVNDPNLGHCDVFDAMTDCGLAYTYGLFRAIPEHHRRKRRTMAEAIANELDRKAERAERKFCGAHKW
jgi:hypothetical protein